MKDTISVVFRAYDDGETFAILFNEHNDGGEVRAFSPKNGFFYMDFNSVRRYTVPATPKQYKAVFEALREEYDGVKIYKRMITQRKQDGKLSKCEKHKNVVRVGWECYRVAVFNSCQILVGVFSSINQAARCIGVRASTVRFACIGSTISCQGWYLRRVDETMSIEEIGVLTLREFDERNGENRAVYPKRGMRKPRNNVKI